MRYIFDEETDKVLDEFFKFPINSQFEYDTDFDEFNNSYKNKLIKISIIFKLRINRKFKKFI